MADRENSPAYAAQTQGAKRVFSAIERAIGDGSSASVSYVDFKLDHGITEQMKLATYTSSSESQDAEAMPFHPATRRPRRGSRTVNSVNLPTSLATVMVPPCCWVTIS